MDVPESAIARGLITHRNHLGPESSSCYSQPSLKKVLGILAAVTMHKRFAATTVLAVALLFSQGGNFLIASLCPHLRSSMASCESQLAEPSMSHEDMGHMQTPSKERTGTEQNSDGIALGQPTGECTHCAVHSRTTSNAVSLRDAEASKRSGDLAIPLTFSRVVTVAASPVALLASRAHGPPGEQSSRYILINIFRI